MLPDTLGETTLRRRRAEFEQAATACFSVVDEAGRVALTRLHQVEPAAENYRQALHEAAQAVGHSGAQEIQQAAQDLSAQVQFLMRAVFLVRKQALRHRRLL